MIRLLYGHESKPRNTNRNNCEESDISIKQAENGSTF